MANYLKRLRQGGVRPVFEMKTVMDGPSIGLFDACHSLGQVAAMRAMAVAIEKAKKTGISFISVRGSEHYGAAAYFAKMALADDMIGFTGTNSPPRTAPWGSRSPFLGTNPFAVAIPAGHQLPIIADMATCVVARGKIILANKKNQPIPLGWAIDKDGEDTTDAKAALQGCVLPFGGPKGSAIAMIIEVLTGVLAGSLLSMQVPDPANNPGKHMAVSHYFGAIHVAAFGSMEDFKATIDKMILDMKASPKAKGVEEIFMPGEIEARKKQVRSREGIPVSQVVLD